MAYFAGVGAGFGAAGGGSGVVPGLVDGFVSADGHVFGTYLHGLLENDGVRHALIDALAARRRSIPHLDSPGGISSRRLLSDREGQLDRLAAMVRASLDLKPLLAACGLG